MKRISDRALRSRLAETLGQVARGDEFIVDRRGTPLAALISAAKFDRLRRFARRHGLCVMEEQKGGQLDDREATELALEAQRWARQQRRR